MSWSFYAVGTRDALSREIDRQCEGYHGLSREEFDAVRPHLKGLLEHTRADTAVQIDASGHGTRREDNTIVPENLSVTIRQLGSILQ